VTAGERRSPLRAEIDLVLALIEQAVIVVGAELEVAQDFAQERSDDDLRPVIRDHDDSSVVVAEDIVASHLTHPSETSCFHNSSELSVWYEPKLGQAATSIFQVPTKSGSGSSGLTV
jgi:hypothetical protein